MFRIRPPAAAELERAARWYTRRGGVAGKFRAEIQQAMVLAHAHPDAFPIVARSDGRLVRRILTRRFPYAIEYAAVPDGIIVLAVRHQTRKPPA